jgi:hypothetical protein
MESVNNLAVPLSETKIASPFQPLVKYGAIFSPPEEADERS